MRSMPRFTVTAATTVTATLALAVLGMPGVALAAGPDAPGARGAAAGQSGPAAPGAAAAEAPGRPTSARPDKPAAARPTKAAPADRPAKPAPPARPAKPAAPAAGKATRTATAPTAKADPRGNNGTFKVDGPVLDTSRGNEPHVTCAFRLSFFGYDAGQLGRISLTAIAPTPGPTTRVDGLPLISTSSAKGGQHDGSYPTAGTLTAADLGLDPTVAHHVKAQVESVDADGSEVPGGAKSKVFWLEPCAAAAPAEVAPAESGPVAPLVDAPVFGPRAVVAAAPVAAPVAVPAETAVMSGTVSAQSVAPSTVVAAPALLLPQGVGAATARPATLPFTGSPQTLILLMAGVVALAGGSVLLVAVRRTP